MKSDKAKPLLSDEVLFFTSVAEYQERQNYTPELIIGPGEVDRIIGKYELPADRTRWASCGLNNCNTEHRFGYVILAKNGRETNIGQDCGKRELGVSFEEVEATFKCLEDEAAKRRTIDALLIDKTTLAARVFQVQGEGARQVAQLSSFIKTFSHLQGFWREVINASKLGGVVRAPVARSDSWSQMGKVQLETVARFQGSAVLLSHEERTPELVGHLVQPWLDGLSVENLQMLDQRELETAIQEAGKMRNLLERAEKFINMTSELLRADNIASLEIICDRVLRSTDAGYARPYIASWVSSARAGKIPTTPVEVLPLWR